jgi:YggT family protein
MPSTLAALSQVLRTALLVGGLVALAIAAVDWAVRTRRINPFNGIARFMRARVEPRCAGIERLVLRAGGHPSATPWWAVFAYVLVALVVIAVADLLLEAVQSVGFAVAAGPLGIIALAIHWTFGVLIIALLVRVVASWVPMLASRPWISWSYGATEWMLRPLRQVLPVLGPVDISPIVAYFGLLLVRFLVEAVILGVR